MALDAGRLFHLAWQHAGSVPAPVLRAVTVAAADVTWLLRTGGVQQLTRNLARARPNASQRELRRLAHAGMRSYMRYYGEAFVMRHATPEQVEARVRVVGYDEVRELVGQGITPVVALSHQGNWDLAGVYASQHIAPVLTVAERLEPPELYEEFKAFREALGMEILTAGDPGVFRTLLRAAQKPGRIICLLADRDLSHRGVEVDYLGTRARVAVGPAALAVSTGAPLVAAGIYYERLTGARRAAAGTPWGIVIRFHPTIDVPTEGNTKERIQAVTQRWVDDLGDDIRAHPQDWHMLQKVFVEDLDAARYAQTVQKSES